MPDLDQYDSFGLTVLFICIQLKSYDTAFRLISRGADINKRNAEGRTPLCLAIIENLDEAIQFLLDKGADPYIADNRGFDACDYAKEGHLWKKFPVLEPTVGRPKKLQPQAEVKPELPS